MHFAHSTSAADRSNWHPLAAHLNSVASLSAHFARTFSAESLAHVAGLLHDVGKYTREFQERLAGAAIQVDHSTRGGIIAAERYGPLGHLLAYVIAGHHAGLANGDNGKARTSLRERLQGIGLPELIDSWDCEITLPQQLTNPKLKLHTRERSGFQLAFLARMLFSCLVDADYLDTEAFFDGVEGRRKTARDAKAPELPDLLASLNSHLSKFRTNSKVNQVRAEILAHVRQQSVNEPGLFSLTVPTGGGKTLSSLAFALDHAVRHGLRRVIFVIPFTSVAEQNAAEFRKALGPIGGGAVLEHHSAYSEVMPPASEPDRYQAREKLRLAMENWDVPIIVTTAVQFFESLFAARPSQCRKLHNIAGSVVIIDEAQTLPIKLLRPAVAAIDELARNYRTSVVLCTATQPALNAPDFRGGLESVRELAPEPPELYRKLDRVRVRHVGTLDDVELAAQLRSRDQVLCIVNNRRHARTVYRALVDLPGAIHLTTLMCAKHRSLMLAEARMRLNAGEPCRLVSTSLIEAGVDISLPSVYRAEAGLDSIAQAAGRCNRHGERAAEHSEVCVFATANDNWAPPAELRQFAQAAQEVMRQPQFRSDPLAPDAIEAYFRLLYWQRGDAELDAADLLGLCASSRIDSLPMETLAAKFRMIDTVQMPVIVPFKANEEDNEAHLSIEGLRHAEQVGALARKLQPYLVHLPPKGFEALRKAGAVQPIAPEKWGEQFMELVNEDLYDPRIGLFWDDPVFIKSESLMW